MVQALAPDGRNDFLRNCMVEGDSDHEKHVRRNRRRALLVSIVIQILLVSTLVLFPLLSHGENIASYCILTPIPPYPRGTLHPRKTPVEPPSHGNHSVSHFFIPHEFSHAIVTRNSSHESPNSGNDNGDPNISTLGDPDGDPSGVLNSDTPRQPRRPEEPDTKAKQIPVRRQISESVQAAMLYHRVEPIYPHLAVQLRHEGRVELRAVIATDGSVQSLEVISGDPLLIPSALAAVREWRYHPTILNGQPVEVDTDITVIYFLSR